MLRPAISVGNLRTEGRAALLSPGTSDLRVDRQTAFGNPFPQQRHMVPLISADNRQPLAAGQLDRMLQLILGRVVGKANASKYSWHSARIYLACSLLAAGASVAQIQALCRWQTEDSLRVYARLNPGSYDKLLTRAASADVLSVSVASLPPLSSELAIRQLLGLSLVDALAASA